MFPVALSARLGHTRCQVLTASPASRCQEVHSQLEPTSLRICLSIHFNSAEKDWGSVGNPPPYSLPESKHSQAPWAGCASSSNVLTQCLGFPKCRRGCHQLCLPLFLGAGRIYQDRGADPLNPGAQNLEQRDSIPVWSANPCSASQPDPLEAKSPANRCPHDQTEKPCRTGLPHLPSSPLLSGPVPGGCHPMGSPHSFTLGLQEATQACNPQEFSASTTSGEQRKRVSLSHFTDRQEVRTGPTGKWTKLFSVCISLFPQLCSHVQPGPTQTRIQAPKDKSEAPPHNILEGIQNRPVYLQSPYLTSPGSPEADEEGNGAMLNPEG